MNLVLRIPREKNHSGLNMGKGLNSEVLFPAAYGFFPLKIAGAAARILNCETSSLIASQHTGRDRVVWPPGLIYQISSHVPSPDTTTK